MTKKSGLFDVDFGFGEIEIISQQAKDNLIHSKSVEDALRIVLQQMLTSGYRTRTMKDYETIVYGFLKCTNIGYLDEIKTETIYIWLLRMKTVRA